MYACYCGQSILELMPHFKHTIATHGNDIMIFSCRAGQGLHTKVILVSDEERYEYFFKFATKAGIRALKLLADASRNL